MTLKKIGMIKSLVWLSTLAYLLRSYLEPGSSSFLLKIIVSSLAGMVVFFRYFWNKIKPLYLRLFSKKSVAAIKPQPEEGDEA